MAQPAALEKTHARGCRRAVFHRLEVADVEQLTRDAVAVTFAVPPHLTEDYAFIPGQHVTLRAVLDGRDVRRSYSICSPATSYDRIRVGVKRVAGGTLSAWVNECLRPGDRLDVMTPTGRFGVQPNPSAHRHLCAVAAGSGITPVLSIVATTLALEPRSSCTLIYGNRTSADVMFLEDLHDLKDRYADRLQVLHVLSREAQESPLLHGRIDRARMDAFLSALVPPPLTDEWYLCGPLGMVDEVRAALAAGGVAAASVHVELFHVEGGRAALGGRDAEPRRDDDAAPGSARVTVVLDGRATVVEVGPGERVLDAVLRARADAPYSCRGGVCGTCRARVVDGEVRMARNFALDAAERAAGFVLACQSRPVSRTVTLDFDS